MTTGKARLLEQLVHLELQDVSVNAQYLHPGFPTVPGNARLGIQRARTACVDCEQTHQIPRYTDAQRNR